MEKIFQLIAEVGLPIAGALAMGAFIFIIIKQLMAGVVGQVKTLTGFCKSLQTRGRVMSNEMIKIDLLLSGFSEDKSGVRVVVDEFGGFVGLIGAEAVLEVLAGWSRKSSR